jgi:hypothetical protein
MNITLKETLKLDIFSNFQLLTGKKGLHRHVSRIGLLDHEMINPIKGQFSEGEFALSTLLAAKDNPSLIYSSVEYLIESKASGLGVKNIYFKELPKAVLDLAESADFPIFIFDNSVYFEDVITEFKGFIDKLNHESDMTSALERLLDTCGVDLSLELYSDLLGSYEGSYFALYIRSQVEIEGSSSMLLKSHRLMKRLSVLFSGFYKNGLFVLLKNIPIEEIGPILETEKLSLEAGYFYGLSSCYHSSKELKRALEESLINARIADVEGVGLCKTEDRGLYDLIMTCKDQKEFIAYAQAHLQPLIEYDQANSSALFETVVEFVKNQGLVKATATSMVQHNNTIRYRLTKIRSLLNIHGSDSVLYERLSMAVKLHLLNKLNY